MTFKAVIFVYLAFFASRILARDLSKCNWIWTNGQAESATTRAFQRVYTPEDGKVPVSAQVLVASAQEHDLYVNDHHIDSHSGPEDDGGKDGSVPVTGRVKTVLLNPGQNIFRIHTHGYHEPSVTPPTGLLSSIIIKFNDGSERELRTDSEWAATTRPHEHHWGRVKVLGSYGDEPWGEIVVLPEPTSAHYGGHHSHHHHHHHHKHHHHKHHHHKSHQTSTFLESYCAHKANHLPPLTTPPLTYSNNASWIWTNETDSTHSDPVGHRAFRKIVCLSKGTTINALNISIDVDDQFELFVQGESIANSTAGEWDMTTHYHVNFSTPVSGPDAVVIAVVGINSGGAANFITAIDFIGNGTSGPGLQGVVVSDSAWKVNNTVPVGFEQPEFDDSSWVNATAYGGYLTYLYGQSNLVDSPTVTTITI